MPPLLPSLSLPTTIFLYSNRKRNVEVKYVGMYPMYNVVRVLGERCILYLLFTTFTLIPRNREIFRMGVQDRVQFKIKET